MNELNKPAPNIRDVDWDWKPLNPYDADYFLRGLETGKSCYTNYTWRPLLTIPMVQVIIARLGILRHETILDFGAARGYVVKAFRELGYTAFGLDCSEWAVDNAHPDIKDFMSHGVQVRGFYDWIIAKDVLEHVVNLPETIENLMEQTHRGLLAIVPLSAKDGEPYVAAEYEKDVTHIHRLTLPTWAAMFIRPGWSVEATYRAKGIKDSWEHCGPCNGFILAKRNA
jgi:hypothetical protein